MFKYWILILTICLSTGLWGQSLKKTNKWLEEGDFEKLEKSARKDLEKDSLQAAASYWLSLVFFQGQRDKQLDSAYFYIRQARLFFTDPETKIELTKDGYSDSLFLQQQQKIEAYAYEHALDNNTEAAYIDFIERFSEASELPQAIENRNQRAFEQASKKDTYEAYLSFINTYPDAKQYKQAKERYEIRLFESKTGDGTLSSYINFINDNPVSPYREKAEGLAFKLTTLTNKPEDYQDYIFSTWSKYDLDRAQAYLYYLQRDQDRPYLPNEAYKKLYTLQQQRWIPFYKLSQYGFFNEKGKEILPPQFDDLSENYRCTGLEGLLFYAKKEQYGMFDRLGQLQIPGVFDSYKEQQNVIILHSNNKVGAWHVSGFPILADQEDIRVLSTALLIALKGKKWRLYSMQGLPILEKGFDQITLEGDFIALENDNKVQLMRQTDVLNLQENKKPNLSKPYADVDVIDDQLAVVKNNTGINILNGEMAEMLPEFQQKVGLHKNYLLLYQSGKVEALGNTKITFKKVKYNENVVCGQQEKWGVGRDWENLNFAYDSVRLFGKYFALAFTSDSLHLYFKNVKKAYPLQAKASLILSATVQVGADEKSEYLLMDLKGEEALFNTDGQLILKGNYDNIITLGNNYLVVEKNGKRGLFYKDGTPLLPVTFDGFGLDPQGLVKTFRKNKFGLYGYPEKVEINPQFDVAPRHWTADLFYLQLKDGYSFINSNGKPAFKETFEEISPWTDSLVFVKKNYEWTILNTDFDIWAAGIKSIGSIYATDEGQWVVIRKDTGYGVLNNKMGEIITPIYTDIINLDNNQPFFFCEKRIEEAEFYVIIYINGKGDVLQKVALEEAAYQKIYCDN